MKSAYGDSPRILIIAYACEPEKGSEQGVGWNWSLQIARFADVTVITRENNRAAISKAMSTFKGPKPHFEFYDPPSWVLLFKKKGGLSLYPFYFFWQFGCRRLVKRLIKTRNFTHIQQLTFGNIWLPVAVSEFDGQFIWGPIGGGEGVPPSLVNEVPLKLRGLQWLRGLLINTLKYNPFILPTLRRADILLIRTQDTMRTLPAWARAKATYLAESGVSSDMLDRLEPAAHSPTLKTPTILYTGRLVAIKNVEMLLYAAGRARDFGVSFNLKIIGDGPERKKLMSLTQRLKLSDRTIFLGAVDYASHLTELMAADIFAFPSLREAGPWSPMEAMCSALPLICVKSSGMEMITSDTCAIRVPPGSREEIISGFAEGIRTLCESQERREKMGLEARKRIRDKYIWDDRGAEWATKVLKVQESVTD
jgi:glycosyltransferase involved in cell wall biosynthesis